MSDITKTNSGTLGYRVYPNGWASWDYTITLRVYTSGSDIHYVVTTKNNSYFTRGNGNDDGDYAHCIIIDDSAGGMSIRECYEGQYEQPADKTLEGTLRAKASSGTIKVRLQPGYPCDDSTDITRQTLISVDYSGAEASTGSIAWVSNSVYDGGPVSVRCTTSGTITSGTVTRYIKKAGASQWAKKTVQQNVTGRTTTVQDTLPAGYAGGQVYYRYDYNGDGDFAVTDTKTIAANSAPSTPATLTVPTTIAGGSTISVSWSASTDPDPNDTVKYVLEKSTDGGASWGDNSVYNGPALETTDTIPFGTERVRYRIHAYDTYGAKSGYKFAPETGDYTVTNNRAPSVPNSKPVISAAQVTTGSHPVITWGSSTDPDGDAFDYVLERSASGGSWNEAYRGTAQRFEETIGSDWTSVKYRVKAQDSFGASSDWAVMDAEQAVISNVAPTLQLSYNTVAVTDGEDIGVIVDPDDNSEFNMSYVVSDTNASDSLTVREIVDGVVRKTITNAVRNQAYSFNFRTGSAASTSYWKKLLDGTHTVIIEVSDGKAVTRRTFTFLKNVGSCLITLKTAIQGATGKKLGIAAVSICGSIPDGCLTSVEVTADGGTHWESCKIASGGTASGIGGRKVKASADLNEALLGGHYLFLHKFTNAGNQFNYRILCTAAAGKNGWISSVQGAFTEIGTSETAVFA